MKIYRKVINPNTFVLYFMSWLEAAPIFINLLVLWKSSKEIIFVIDTHVSIIIFFSNSLQVTGEAV